MNFRTPLAFWWQIALTLVIAVALSACGGARSARGTNLTVTGTTSSEPVTGGGTVVFTMTVANTGDDTATDVRIVNGIGNQLALTSITCTASGGVACPETPSVSMTIPTMNAGASLTFVVSATVAATANGTIVNTMTATINDDVDRTDNTITVQASAVAANSFGVTQSGAATVGAGSSAVFTADVSNAGGGTATNVTINWALTAAFATTNTVSCQASSGAECPTVLGPAMTLASLAPGRTLRFTFNVAVPEAARGNITSVVTVAATGDPDPSNNLASVTTTAVNGGNGTYKAYAADGRLYDLTVDFDALTYTMAGNGQSVQKNFTVDPNGDYSVNATSKFRTSADLIVGGHDFGNGNLPYVAARIFGTTLNELTGTYNLASRNLLADGSALTRPGTARVSGNVLQVCETPTLVSVTQACESGYLTSYTLTVQDSIYTATEIRSDGQTPQVTSFRLASSGASKMLLGAQQLADGSQQLRIGLPDSSALAGGTLRGASSTGDWVNIELTSTTYLFNGVNEVGDDAALDRISNAGPFAMATGVRRTDGLTIYVMQASPLVVVIDAPTTPAGLMQIALP